MVLGQANEPSIVGLGLEHPGGGGEEEEERRGRTGEQEKERRGGDDERRRGEEEMRTEVTTDCGIPCYAMLCYTAVAPCHSDRPSMKHWKEKNKSQNRKHQQSNTAEG